MNLSFLVYSEFYAEMWQLGERYLSPEFIERTPISSPSGLPSSCRGPLHVSRQCSLPHSYTAALDHPSDQVHTLAVRPTLPLGRIIRKEALASGNSRVPGTCVWSGKKARDLSVHVPLAVWISHSGEEWGWTKARGLSEEHASGSLSFLWPKGLLFTLGAVPFPPSLLLRRWPVGTEEMSTPPRQA